MSLKDSGTSAVAELVINTAWRKKEDRMMSSHWLQTLVMAMAGAAIAGTPIQALAEDAPGGQIRLKTPDGKESNTLMVACSNTPVFDLCLFGQSDDAVITFVVPPGYKRLNFSFTTTKNGIN